MLTRKKTKELECGRFQERWRYQYFFGEANGKPICLICKQQVEVAQEDVIQTHYSDLHAVKFDKYRREKRKEKAAQLDCSLKKLQFLQGTALEESDAEVKAGYMIAHTIVTSRIGKPFSGCAFIKECMLMTAEVICPDKRQIFANIDLSLCTIVKRIGDLSRTLNRQLIDKVETFIAFSVSIDEYSIGNEVSHLAVFIRGVDNNMEVTEEFVDLILIKELTAIEICKRLMKALNKLCVDWTKIVSLARDNGPSSISSKVATIFKKELLVLNPGKCFYDLHSIWHSEVLYIEVLKIDNIIDGVTKIVRGISTGRPVLFAKFHPMDHYGIFEGSFLKRIHTMCDDLHEHVKKEDVPELEDIKWLQDLAFVVDVKEHLINLQAKVMEHNKLVMDSYYSMSAFEEELDLMEEQLSEDDLTHFPRLKSRRAMDSLPCVSHNEKCRSKILKLKKEFQSRIGSFENLEELFTILLDPFTVDPYEAPEDLKSELIELQCDLFLRNKFSSLEFGTFYKHLESKYSNLKSLAVKILSMFGSMKVHKKLFQFLNSNTSKYFFRTSDKIWKSGMKIATAQALSPDFDMLVQIWKERQAEVPIRTDDAGVSSGGADIASSSVTDPVWSDQGKTLDRNQKNIGRGHLRSKKITTEQDSSDECLDGNEPEVYIDVAEHPEDSSKRKHSLGDDEEFLIVSDRRKYIKSEDGVDVKIEISQEYLFDEPSREQNIEKNMSDGKEFPSVNDGKTYIKSEYDVDVKTEISQEYLS